MSARFYEIFELVATIVICLTVLSIPFLVWKADRDFEREEESNKNKKAP